MASAIRFRVALSALLLWVGASVAIAQDAVSAASGSVASSPVTHGATTLSGGGGISILGYVLSVLVLAVAAGAMLFRGGFLGMVTGASKTERKLHIEESRSLGHRQYLVVASYEGRRFLLGVCPGSIEYLSGLDPEPLPPAGSFQELLSPDSAVTADAKVAGSGAAVDKSGTHKDAP